MTDIDKRIYEIMELDKARTQGEWLRDHKYLKDDDYIDCLSIHLGNQGIIYDEGGHTAADADFICAAPEMVSIIKHLQAQLMDRDRVIEFMTGALESIALDKTMQPIKWQQTTKAALTKTEEK